MSGNRNISNNQEFLGNQGSNGIQGLQGFQGATGTQINGIDGSVTGLSINYDNILCSSKGYASIFPDSVEISSNGCFIIGPIGTGYISSQTTGNSRGTKSIDFQRGRNNPAQVASGSYSVILGGSGNLCSGSNAVITGGKQNKCKSNGSVIAGGLNNYIAGGSYSCILGGENNGGSNTQGSYVGFIAGKNNSFLNSAFNSHCSIIGGKNSYLDNNSYCCMLGGADLGIISDTTFNGSTIIGGKLYIDSLDDYGNVTVSTNALVINDTKFPRFVKQRTLGNITSDERLKTEIEEMTDADFDIEYLKQLKLISFQYKNRDDDKRYYGFSAQNLQDILPHLVKSCNDGTLGYNLISLLQYLFGVVRKRQNQIDSLKNIVDYLESKILE